MKQYNLSLIIIKILSVNLDKKLLILPRNKATTQNKLMKMLQNHISKF